VSARALQDVVVCAHHGCTFVDALARETLSPAEQAMFGAVDRRAFAADADRRHRAVVAVAEEVPVAIAIAGLPAVYALFDDRDIFLAVVRGEAPMAVQFARGLEGVAGDAARIEGAVARARRHRRLVAGIGRADGVEVATVSDGALSRYEAARRALGDDVVAAVCGGRRLPTLGSGDGAVVLATRGPAGVDLAGCSAALGALLDRCDGLTEADFIAHARALGCDDDDEARALLADLVGDGLLVGV
jgi:hypothetical protein